MITFGYIITYVICSTLAYVTEQKIEVLVARGARMELAYGPVEQQKKTAAKIAIFAGPLYFIGLISFFTVCGIAYVFE